MIDLLDPAASPGPWERRSRSVGFGIFVLALGVLAGAGARSASPGEGGVARLQARQTIALTEAQRDALLQEMRGMLGAMQGVMDGAQALDVPKMRAAARAAGMSAATHDETLRNEVPREFRAKLIETHAAFDDMADAIRGFTARDTVLTHLARISDRCVSCHAAYKFGPAR